MARANKNRESAPDWKELRFDRSPASLKGQWYSRMQPAIQKFAGLVTKFPPRSGMQKDDVEYDLYWKSICLLYKQQAPKGLLKYFSPYFKNYMFLI